VGALAFASDLSRGEVALSSAPLTGSTTAMLALEPFVNPFGTKLPKIVSGYGKREVPAQLLAAVASSTGAAGALPPSANAAISEVHEGVDYRAFPGSAVRAARSGKVIFAGFSKMYVSRADKTEQHRLVIIRHADGTSSRYVHLNALHVRPGQDVQSGQVLGVLAESDEWTEPVLHFEIRDIRGQPMNPKDYVDKAPAPAAGKGP
jgi:murein DD-endopeptidase MepM/ murein hydrolase activator NlpD